MSASLGKSICASRQKTLAEVACPGLFLFCTLCMMLMSGIYSIDPNFTSKEQRKTIDYMKKFFWVSFSIFLIVFSANVLNAGLDYGTKKDLRRYENKMKIGLLGMILCSIVGEFAWFYLDSHFEISCSVIEYSKVALIAIYGISMWNGSLYAAFQYFRFWKEALSVFVSLGTICFFISQITDIDMLQGVPLFYNVCISIFILDIIVIQKGGMVTWDPKGTNVQLQRSVHVVERTKKD